MADADRERERVRWHCRRGMLELDLILQQAFERHYDSLNEAERKAFARLLSLEDAALLACLQGKEIPADSELNQLLKKIQQ